MLAANSVPANTLAELIASAKREPQRYSFALSSLGAAGHLATLEFNSPGRRRHQHGALSRRAAALTDLGSNSVQLFIDAGVAALQQVRAGRMKVLAITTAERSPLAPEVPTAAESGLPGFVFNSWYGVWGPRACRRPSSTSSPTACNALSRTRRSVASSPVSAPCRRSMDRPPSPTSWPATSSATSRCYGLRSSNRVSRKSN